MSSNVVSIGRRYHLMRGGVQELRRRMASDHEIAAEVSRLVRLRKKGGTERFYSGTVMGVPFTVAPSGHELMVRVPSLEGCGDDGVRSALELLNNSDGYRDTRDAVFIVAATVLNSATTIEEGV